MAPFSLLFGLGVSFRDICYRYGLLKGVSFNLPVIAVGNLTVGGAGKTPHIEYLIRLLKDYLNIATLSRGYKRKTKGYLTVRSNHDVNKVGDEPLQFKRKYPELMVAVSESRTLAIPQILMERPDTQLVLLDDAFQHRAIIPGLNILLTEFNYPFTRDYLLPSGRLREWRSAYERADLIIVSKCPPEISIETKAAFIKEINPFSNQKIYFSYYDYLPPYSVYDPRLRVALEPDVDVLLICAIARAEYLVDYLEEQVQSVAVLEYEDHHLFSNYDVAQLKKSFEQIPSQKKIILTTEKDAMRLELHQSFLQEHRLPIFALPIQVKFHFDEGEQFNEDVRTFLLNFKV